MEVGARIGSGQTAEIYALGTERVVKRFGDGIPRSVAEREATNTQIAVDAGLPVPSVYEVTSLNGNPAIIYEQVRGKTMLSQLRSCPWTLRRNARRLACLHTEIHAIQPSGLQQVRKCLSRDIQKASGLDPEERDHVLSKVEQLPCGRSLCHGDFHPDNVILADEPVVIDWLDAGQGHPAADVARTNLLLKFVGQYVGRIPSLILTGFRRWYLRSYLRKNNISRDQIRAWELPVAVARLTENVPEEPQLRSFISSQLSGE